MTDVLTARPGQTFLIRHEETGKEYEATANGQGELTAEGKNGSDLFFDASAWNKIEEIENED